MEKVIQALGFSGRRADAARADDHRLRHSGALHLQERPARAGDDRLRQGHDDLCLHHRRGRRHPVSSSAASARSSTPPRSAYAAKVAAKAVPAAGLTLAPAQIGPYVTLAIGSAMALFMYPHALTGALAASSGRAIRRNTMTLPAYSFVLGLIALLGVMAMPPASRSPNPQDAVPQLVLWVFPDWFAGFSFAAIALGALVPAAVMSIGAANTFTRNVWKPFVHPQMTPREDSFLAKLVSLIVKVGALMVIFFMPTQFALDLQLLGGVWMVQIFPAMIFGLFTRWFSGPALLIGWAVGMILGTSLAWGERPGPRCTRSNGTSR